MTDGETNGIFLLGAGNLATHLGLKLRDSGYRVTTVFSRTIESARALAGRLGARPTDDPSWRDEEATILIFCLPDDVIPGILGRVNTGDRILIHTTGSVPSSVFGPYSEHYGVLYPLQTFSRDRDPEWEEIPLCIEASNDRTAAVIRSVAESISDRVVPLDSDQRRQLHLSGVIASNFTNHLYRVAFELAAAGGIDPGLLVPLILETARKAVLMGPAASQTGPAVRGDLETRREHVRMLEGRPEIQKLYTFMSENIARLKKGSGPAGD